MGRSPSPRAPAKMLFLGYLPLVIGALILFSAIEGDAPEGFGCVAGGLGITAYIGSELGDGILAAGVVTNPLSAARQGDQSSAHAAGSTAGAARFNKCVTVAQE